MSNAGKVGKAGGEGVWLRRKLPPGLNERHIHSNRYTGQTPSLGGAAVQRKRGTLQLRIAGLQFGGWFQALSRGSVWSVRALWLGGGRDGGGARAGLQRTDSRKERRQSGEERCQPSKRAKSYSILYRAAAGCCDEGWR